MRKDIKDYVIKILTETATVNGEFQGGKPCFLTGKDTSYEKFGFVKAVRDVLGVNIPNAPIAKSSSRKDLDDACPKMREWNREMNKLCEFGGIPYFDKKHITNIAEAITAIEKS